jgi:hypothetical protein
MLAGRRYNDIDVLCSFRMCSGRHCGYNDRKNLCEN